MASIKYVAAGFLKDSENLLNDFVKESSTDFPAFATKWKEYNFGLIFSGRDKHELQQFTHEIFQLTLGYLQNSSFFLQVGAVYLLYALYRNQTSTPPVKIRIVLSNWEVIKKLKVISEENCFLNLHYVINFLHTNAFDFVAHAILFGPCSTNGKVEGERPSLHAPFMLKDCKNEMSSFLNSNLLEEVKDLTNEYAKLGQKIFPLSDKRVDGSQLEEYVNCLETLVNDGTYSRGMLHGKSEEVDLGNRRAKIKEAQFARKALFRQLNPSDSDEDYEPPEQKEKRVRRFPRKRRLPKHKRRVGRPKKYDLEKLLEAEGIESDQDYKPSYIRKRGPASKSSYLEKYEFKIPENSKKTLKDFLGGMTTDTSEEESSDYKETQKTTSDIASDNSEQGDKDIPEESMALDMNESQEIADVEDVEF